ncbi:MAG: hypothetical protein AAF772_20420 [Acidobacteriota bacterium]
MLVRLSSRVLAAAAAIALLLGPAALRAQDPAPPAGSDGEDVRLVLSDGSRSLLRLAMPTAVYDPSLGGSGALAEAAREAEQTLRDDLEYSGIFRIQGADELSVLTLTGNAAGDFEQYRSLGNELVLYVTFKAEDGRLVLEGRIYDLPSGQSVLGKRYRGQPDQARRVAHTFADAIILQFTGRSGIARSSIAFHSDRDGHQEIYLMDYDGRNQRRITGHRSTSGFPAWSPTGDAIAYLSYFTTTPTVYYVDVASGEKIEVFGGGSLNLAPAFSPDGQRIAFAHAQSDANVDIYLCDRRCQNPQRLTRTGGIDTNPAWSPDGQRIAFTSDRSSRRPHVYLMNADGSNVQRISFEGNYNDGAAWRPDGNALVYASRRGNKFRVVLTDLVSLETTVLTNGPDSYESPSFSPDGKHVVFTAKRGPRAQIHVMRADGSGWRQLTHDGNNHGPDWSPLPD